MKFIYLIIFNFLLSANLGWAYKHPVYVSVTEIHYKPEKQKIEIAMKIFGDDLAEVLGKIQKQTIEIGTEREHQQTTNWIQNYTRQHFSLRADNQILEYKYVGREMVRSDFFAMWVYWEITNVRDFKTLEVENTLLHDFFYGQNNVITYRIGNQVKRASLVKGGAVATF